jgi:hypothetical protein
LARVAVSRTAGRFTYSVSHSKHQKHGSTGEKRDGQPDNRKQKTLSKIFGQFGALLKRIWMLCGSGIGQKGRFSCLNSFVRKTGVATKFVRFDKRHYDSFSFAAAINTSMQAHTCRVASHRSHAYVLRLVDEIELPPLRH